MNEKPIDPKQYRSALQSLLGSRPVAYYPSLARAVGGVRAALLLSQLMYWQSTKVGNEFYKVVHELTDETGLTTDEQATARKQLVTLGVITAKRRGKTGVWHYQVDLDRICDLIAPVKIPASSESGDARIRDPKNQGTQESGDPRIRGSKNQGTQESGDARIRGSKNQAKPELGFGGERNLTEDHIDELNTENTTETTNQEEEAKPASNFLVLDQDLIDELLAYGLFKSKLRQVDDSGWTANQIRQMMIECRKSDKRGTPAALLLTRLQEMEPPKPGYGYPQYNILPEPPDEPSGPSLADLVDDAIEQAMRSRYGDKEAAAISKKVEFMDLSPIEGSGSDVPSNAILLCQPVIWDRYIQPNADLILDRMDRLGITQLSYGG